METSTVLIIGGGIAGLSAAAHLRQNNIKCVLLEAKNRLGGRMLSMAFGSGIESAHEGIVELGANWIHGGSTENSAYALAEKYDIVRHPLVYLDRMDGTCNKSTGEPIRKGLVDEMWNEFKRWEDDLSKNPRHGRSLLEYYNDSMKEYLSSNYRSNYEDMKCIFNSLLNYAHFHEGGYIENMEAVELYYEVITGGNVKVPPGMNTIIDVLSKQIQKEYIRLNHVVCKVDWAGRDDQGSVIVTCKNGAMFNCDHVIVTLPLGVLKANQNELFTPQLPASHQQAIMNLGFGKVSKIILHWDKPFWEPGQGSIKLAWSDKDLQTMSDTNEHWYRKIFSFDEVLNNPSILLGWLSGDEAEAMERLSDDEVVETCIKLLRTFTGKLDLPPPSKMIRSMWCTDQFTLGGYSFHQGILEKHTTAQSNINDELGKPVLDASNVPRILFAGEAVSRQSYSTMHGARDTGIVQAEVLTAYINQKSHL